MQPYLFWIVASLAGLSAIMVVVTQNIVRAAAWLLFALAGTAGVYFLLGSDLIGATQLIVYVGGTMVLVVFGVMLTAQGPFVTLKTGAGEWALSLMVGISLYAALALAAINTAWIEKPPADVDESGSGNIVALGTALMGVNEATPTAYLPDVTVAGNPKVREKVSYLLPFEIVSVHLLVVLIGAAYLARAKRRLRAGGAA